jgi:flagellar motor switch protein FliM
MNRVLSQEEIDALLNSAADPDRGKPAASPTTGSQPVVSYNFRRPDRVTKDQMRSLHFLHDRFARNVSTSMSAYMRVVTEVSILSVEQFTYSEFLMSLSDPTAFYAVSMRPLEGIGALELNPSVAFTMIDRMLGGSGRGVIVSRALTEIEQNVTDGVVKLILENLTDAWRGIVDVQFRISGRETRPQMLQVAAPNEVVLLLSFEIKIGETRGVLNLCFPAASIEAVSGGFTRSWNRTRREMTPNEHDALEENLKRITVNLEAGIHVGIGAGDFLRLSVGDVIGLDHPASEPIEVRVNGKPKFAAIPAAAGSRAQIRLQGPFALTHSAA